MEKYAETLSVGLSWRFSEKRFWGKNESLTLETWPLNLVFAVTCLIELPNLRKIGQKLWSLLWTKRLWGQTDPQTYIQVILHLPNAMNCLEMSLLLPTPSWHSSSCAECALLLIGITCFSRLALSFMMHHHGSHFNTLFNYSACIFPSNLTDFNTFYDRICSTEYSEPETWKNVLTRVSMFSYWRLQLSGYEVLRTRNNLKDKDLKLDERHKDIILSLNLFSCVSQTKDYMTTTTTTTTMMMMTCLRKIVVSTGAESVDASRLEHPLVSIWGAEQWAPIEIYFCFAIFSIECLGFVH